MRFLIRDKFTNALKAYLTIHMLRKLRRDAEEKNLIPALRVEFTGGYYYEPEKWMLLPEEEFKRLKESWEEHHA